MPTCPSIEALDDYASGAEDADLSGHLETRVACQDRLEEIRRNNEALAVLATEGAEKLTLEEAAEHPFEGYRVQCEIHRGGQGVIYKALQLATNRTVAIKVPLQGELSSPSKARRFEREIELVSRLRHPNIVTVHDSGITPDGRRYFVMEYVRGLSLDSVLLRASEESGAGERVTIDPMRTWTLDELLGFFVKVCEGVGYAHKRGVIHRDLKPSNIVLDAQGEPRILDFGLAKSALRESIGDDMPLTLSGEFVGTLAYASPEQVGGDPELVDIRSDVYSLGVILYRLLTGLSPYGSASTVAQLVRAIGEAEPRSPSTARKRQAGAGALDSPIRQLGNAELDAVVLTALAKDRARRYQSAGELARDLRNILEGRPVDARRDSTLYVLGKLARRHRLAVGSGIGVILLLSAAAVVALAGWRSAAEESRVAQLEEAKSSELNEILVELFDAIDPDVAKGRDVPVKEILNTAAQRLENDPPSEPEVELSVRRLLSGAYKALGLQAFALTHLRAALAIVERDPDSPDSELLRSLLSLGDCLVLVGDDEAAEALYLRAQSVVARAGLSARGEAARAVRGLASVSAARADYDRAEELYEEAAQRFATALGPDSPDLATILRDEGIMLVDAGKLDAAAEVLARAESILAATGLEGSLLAADVLREQARVADRRGELDEADSRIQDAYTIASRLLGDDHPGALLCLAYRASILQRTAAGVPAALAEKLWEIQTSLPAAPSKMVALIHNNIAVVAEDSGRLQQAEQGYRLALECYTSLPGRFEYPRTIVMGNLSWVLSRTGQLAEAVALGREAAERYENLRGGSWGVIVHHSCLLSYILLQAGQLEEAQQVAEGALAHAREHLPARDARTGLALSALGLLRCKHGRNQEGEELLRPALAILIETGGELHLDTLYCRHRLAECLRGLERVDEAEELYRGLMNTYPQVRGRAGVALELGQMLAGSGHSERALEAFEAATAMCRAEPGRAPDRLVVGLNNAVRIHSQNGDASEAESGLREAVTVARMHLPPTSEDRLESLQNLRSLLESEGRLEESLSLLEEIHACRRQAGGDRHPSTVAAARMLISLYKTLGREGDAERVSAQLELANEDR